MPPETRQHIPVTPDRVRELAAAQSGDTVVDGTFGAGGHARLIAPDLVPSGTYIGIDRDPDAKQRFDDFATEVPKVDARFIGTDFPDAFARLLADGTSAAAVILDVGVSSMQLDQLDRGFSYSHDAPLDMRMDQTSGRTAAELIATASEAELTQILREYGEERAAKRIARAIVRERVAAPIDRTHRLVDVIRSALPAGGRASKGGHPAKRTFQALRITINDELGMLDRGLDAAFELLAPGGRLVVMSFHSLEDRMVKRRFVAWQGECKCPPGLPVCGCGFESLGEVITRGAERPSESEVAGNPRAASTKLRAFRKAGGSA